MAPRRHDRGLVKAKKEAMAAARSNVNTIRIRPFEDIPRYPEAIPNDLTAEQAAQLHLPADSKEQNLTNPWLPSDVTAIQLQNLYRQVRARFKQVQTFSYPGNSMEDSSVPVTTPSHEKITYHIITSRDVRPKVGRDHCVPAEGRKYDGPAVTIQLLKEESDNYITAWSVLRNGGNARWFAFHDNVTDLDPQIFGDVTVVKYSGGYTSLHDVNISRHTLPRAIDFLVNFDPDALTTNIGIIIFHSLFVMFGEGQARQSSKIRL
ncbi:uncharacterized protein LOC100832916 isoform X3 [Brachypodium distachyon]|nr:uncharacterized protein LOC100832916 isoform X3 [Brachypodium distachyon]XP_024311632.1 uncharacterized protein LOC100832916 isoform X3 [Brachypodium distachyon]XP_024311633.1 uncharacterized protein LOC100832916 isoform X3 [Brachypodium distachyon]XP_024311634.1 uncharacterized protein LOC100832916 isoform X3 [Brachypodium distachyon]XP_024311635.1 uncharacterized protein LOC100832916 isoform X3 [Brachypodium distachyon]XP_024311636.1 uncharacterized protein LOC100832916 isoform X3 [Brachy|eukprot:XP_024311631.1 uncharacterized protein LOC100832916 isoform X3 [Brachypodium distachyon]